MKILQKIVTIIFIFFYCSAYSQTTQLTFDEAVKTALEQNVTLKTQENQLRAIDAQKLQSKIALAPSISSFSQFWISDGNFFIQQEARVINTVSNNLWSGVSARLTLFNGFNRLNTIRQADYQYEAQEALVQRTEQDIINIVASQYLQVLLDQELLKIAQDNLKTQQVQLTQIKDYVEAGTRALPEQYNQEAQVKSLEFLVIQAENALINDRALLAQTLMMDPQTDFEVVAPNWSLSGISSSKYTLDELFGTAMTKRADLKQSQLNELAFEKGIAIAKSGYLPSIIAETQFSSRWTDASNDRNFREQFYTDNFSKEYQLQLSIPIFSNFTNRTQVVRAKIDYENAKLTTQDTENRVASDVQRAYQALIAAERSLVSAKAQLESAELAYTTQEELFEYGQGNALELAQANNTLIQAQANLAQAEYTLLFQDILLSYATGELDPENVLSK